jgi:hypothetical protein
MRTNFMLYRFNPVFLRAGHARSIECSPEEGKKASQKVVMWLQCVAKKSKANATKCNANHCIAGVGAQHCTTKSPNPSLKEISSFSLDSWSTLVNSSCVEMQCRNVVGSAI